MATLDHTLVRVFTSIVKPLWPQIIIQNNKLICEILAFCKNISMMTYTPLFALCNNVIVVTSTPFSDFTNEQMMVTHTPLQQNG